ncbi:unnamed protein product [Lathyrus sativus]|nr:unnamed protein product [Lathyrus sativus]
MQCLPLPKAVIRKIDSICRSFIWTGKDSISRKCLVAWNRTCCPIAQGGLNLLNLQVWNKDKSVMNYETKAHNSWIMRGILKHRDNMGEIRNDWDQIVNAQEFKVSILYKGMIDDGTRVQWRNLVQFNKGRPRAVFCLW